MSTNLNQRKKRGGGKGQGDLPQNILEIIRNYLTVKDTEKKLFGEVFTPVELICEMLDKLPKEVWSNPDNKWLDPANGIGNFPLVAYYRLMDGLKDVKPDREERSKHIIENMLYMVELNPINCEVCKKIFKMIDGKANPNIVTADFLINKWEMLWLKHKGLKSFDIVMGNPPFSNNFNTGDNKPYICFTSIGIDILNKNGFIVFITPPSIYDYLLRRKTIKQKCSNLSVKIEKLYHIHTISINSKELSEYFKNIGSEFTYFLINKKNYTNKTRVYYTKKSYEDNVDLLELPINQKLWFSIISDKIFRSIFTKLFNNKKTYIFHKALFDKVARRIRKTQIDDGTVTVKANSSHKYTILDSYNTKSGSFNPLVYYYTKKDNDFNKKRLIMMTGPSYLYPYIISDNSYTLSDNIVYINSSEDFNCENFLLFLTSPLGKYIDSITRPSNNNNSLLNLLSNLNPLPKKIGLQLKELYSHFKLTDEEQQLIDKKK
jgi:hypothetical protein